MEGQGQLLKLANRERLEVTGVRRVVSFDVSEIIVETSLGSLVLKGEGMSITHLDQAGGELVVEGQINQLVYPEEKGKRLRAKGRNILDRLLK